jgi:hypothetical protein
MSAARRSVIIFVAGLVASGLVGLGVYFSGHRASVASHTTVAATDSPKPPSPGATAAGTSGRKTASKAVASAGADAAGHAYYVDCSAGNDSNSGTSPSAAWKTLPKVSSTTFAAGASVLLKRGCTFSGGLGLNGSGTAAAPITLAAYGSGAAPVVRGGSNDVFSAGPYQVVQDLLLTDASHYGVQITGANDTVQDTEISDSGGGVLVDAPGARMLHDNVQDLKLILNTPGDAYGAVGYVIESANDEIAYSMCTDCEAPSDEFGTEGGFAEVWDSGDNLYVHDNMAVNTSGFFQADGDSQGTHADNLRIAYNVLVNTGRAVLLETALPATASFDNNTFYDTATTSAPVVSAPSGELAIRNNIFDTSVMKMIDTGTGYGVPDVHTGNLYDLAEGVNLTLGTSEKTGNPLFVAAGSNFALQSDSPAINLGTADGYSTADYNGASVPASGPVNAGAFQ